MDLKDHGNPFMKMSRSRSILLVIFLVILLSGISGIIFYLTNDPTEKMEEQFFFEGIDNNWDPGPYYSGDNDFYMDDNGNKMWCPDKLSDIDEIVSYKTNWSSPDTDKDGMEDGWEILYMKWYSISMAYSTNPLVFDAFNNSDGDGYDENGDGVIDLGESLFNLREYCGGAKWNTTTNCFDESDPIFGGLNPVDDWREIGMKGGFHLYDDPCDGILGNLTNPDIHNSTFDDYLRYNPEFPDYYGLVTTDPGSNDTDADGFDDGYEYYHGMDPLTNETEMNGDQNSN